MPQVPGLRSPKAKVGRVVYFGRMLDKIRLQATGHLPKDYLADAHYDLDGQCCAFLGVKHSEVVARVREGLEDIWILEWCHEHGARRTDLECEEWNREMLGQGLDERVVMRLAQRLGEAGLAGLGISTFFEMIEAEESEAVYVL